MKKRIKRKIGNRIMKNIMDGRPLSKFDRRYAGQTIGCIIDRIDQLYLQEKMNVKTVNLYVDNKCVSTSVEKEPMRSFKVEENAMLSMFETPMAIVSTEEHNQIHTCEEQNKYLSEKSEPIFYEPSKWQKIKDKMKGWFSK